MEGRTFDVQLGRLTPPELRARLLACGVQLNAYAEILFAHPGFAIVPPSTVQAVIRTVGGLGFPDGATFPEVFARAAAEGLALCPLEAGPCLRLQHPDFEAPTAPLTVASAPLTGRDDDPKGFYLRTMDGQPWVRGFCCDAVYRWAPEAGFVFVIRE